MEEGRVKICYIHANGRSPTQSVTFDPECPVCVARRGHLPPEKRDDPGQPRKFQYGRAFPKRYTGEQMREMRRKQREAAMGPGWWDR